MLPLPIEQLLRNAGGRCGHTLGITFSIWFLLWTESSLEKEHLKRQKILGYQSVGVDSLPLKIVEKGAMESIHVACHGDKLIPSQCCNHIKVP